MKNNRRLHVLSVSCVSMFGKSVVVFLFAAILSVSSFVQADETYNDSSLPSANIVTGSSGVGNVTIDISGTKSYDNIISGSGTLTKTGKGELTLTKQNTVSGGVTVNNGTLTLTYVGGTGTLERR